jgi:hypothetical protein
MFIAVPVVAMLRVLVQDLAPVYPDPDSGALLSQGAAKKPRRASV